MIIKTFGDLKIPALGLGTWRLNGNTCKNIVLQALNIGYRHIDTADAYGNEQDIGRAIAQSGISRDDIFLTTKLPWEKLRGNEVIAAMRQSLDKLQTQYTNLLLIHWPSTQGVPVKETLEAMQMLKADGKIRAIGVSNFTPTLLTEALKHANILCNQVEYHPFLAQSRLLEMATENELMITAYCPIARGKVSDSETIKEIAETHDKLPTQITLRWLIQQKNVVAIPKTANPEHLKSNFDIFDFELSEAEMNRISGLNQGLRLIDPEFAPHWES
ncbi:aldo/keto reductase [Fulvivirga ulvae]|uniref:aldo/keto reductase n=1 Tax=Fulvivirga ulvae TaxID=2904245 RepID=UPI001F478C0D|nr:aldo/keto reductase [Fulvivirga ulvae]UII32937.1 aldo/keto reductase [Fulvivirga ulvae]